LTLSPAPLSQAGEGRISAAQQQGRYTAAFCIVFGIFTLIFRRYAVLRSRIPVILLALLAVLMVGCGQKGPLYHPDDEQKSQQRDKDVFGL